jgi:hypothetical protein
MQNVYSNNIATEKPSKMRLNFSKGQLKRRYNELMVIPVNGATCGGHRQRVLSDRRSEALRESTVESRFEALHPTAICED